MTNRIAELRKERRISQAELADEVDVTRQTIISLENGRYNASLLLAQDVYKRQGPRYAAAGRPGGWSACLSPGNSGR